jgi:HEAT repeat protein
MDNMEQVLADLDSDDIDVRWHAICRFLNESVNEAVEPLIARLSDPDASVRAKAAQALAHQYGDRPRLFEPIQQALRDEDVEVRVAAADTLWRVGLNDSRTFPALRPLLHDPEPEVRAAAAEAVGHNGDRHALRPLIYLLHDADADVRQAACKGLGSLGLEAAKHALFDVIQNESERPVRYKAIEALGHIGRPRSATPTFRELIFEDEDIVNVLIGVMTDFENDDSWTRTEAAEALARIGDHRATGPLIAWACNWQLNDREDAVSALGYLGDTRATPYLIALLSDDSAHTRFMTISALSNLNDPRALPELDRLARDGSLEPNPHFGSERAAAAKAAAEIREELSWQDFDSLKNYLADEDEDKREKAVKCLATLGDPRVLDLLLPVLTDHNALVFLYAVGYIANAGDARALPGLAEAAAYWRTQNFVGATAEAEDAMAYLRRRLAGEDPGRFKSILDDEDEDTADEEPPADDDDLLAGWFNGDSPDLVDDD